MTREELDADRSPPTSLRRTIVMTMAIAATLFVVLYLVLPGFILGFCFRTGLISPNSTDPQAKADVNRLLSVPLALAEQFPVIGDFYAWECYVVSGYR